MKFLVLLAILVTTPFLHCFSQYVNTDELVFIHGFEKPVTFEQYCEIRDSVLNTNPSFLSGFLIPGNGRKVISPFGWRSGRIHYGTDIKFKKGDTVLAVNSGYVSRAGWGSGFGKLVIIDHGNNIETYYAHLSKFLKAKGEWIEKGEPLGLAGATGRARGAHLHFEIRENGVAFNPELLFDFEHNRKRDEVKNFETIAALQKIFKTKENNNNHPLPDYYKVRSGDSLWTISRRYQISIKEICRLNNLSANSLLNIGQVLRLN